MNYRPDIDGLRAFSVAAVIAFHLKVFFSGGYVGVDVFFVISGYLIGQIVLDATSNGTFSFLTFYERRARRILPALLFTLFWSFAAASAFLTPRDMVEFAKSSLAALLFTSNIFFFLSNAYFGPQAAEIPLLHLWSLGVEEQFYVGFPILAVLLARFRQKWLTVALVAGAVSSIVWSQLDLGRNPEAAFYLIQSRMFELIAGVLLLRLPGPRPSHVTAEIVSWLGAALLGIALFALDERTPFPGVAALVPCCGAAAIIWSGRTPTRISRLLSWGPIAYVGKISYPLYLAHWPLIVFGGMAFPGASEFRFALVVFVLSLILAILTYHLIERPLRFGRSRFKPLTYIGTAAFCFTLVSILALTTSGLEWRFDQKAREVLNLNGDNPLETFRKRECFLDPDQRFADFAMQKCVPYHRPQVLLWGDSHAAHHFLGLKTEFEAAGYSVAQLTASACPPIAGYVSRERPHCAEINDQVLRLIGARNPEIVILSAFWKPFHPDALRETVLKINRSTREVVVFGNTPIFQEAVPHFLATTEHSAQIGVSDRSDTERRMRELFANGQVNNVRFLSLMDIACPADHCVISSDDGRPYYFDEGHLTSSGSLWMARQIVPRIVSTGVSSIATKPSN